MNNPNYYAIIPANVRYDNKLKDKAKLLYGEISALSNQTGYCWATNSYFAKLYGIAPESVSRLISNLAESGYISVYVDKDNNNKRSISILTKTSTVLTETSRPIDENINTPIDENVKYNNTSKNTTKNTIGKHLEKQLGEPIDHPDKIRFTDWWDAYAYQIVSEQRDCVMIWQRLTVEETKQIMAHTAKYCKANDKRYRKRPFRYLNEREYLNEVPQAEQDKPAFTLSVQKTNH